MVLDAEAPAGEPLIVAMGEAKASSNPMGMDVLHRLERSRELVRRAGAVTARLLLFSTSGFDRTVRAEAQRRHDLELVDLDRLYGGE